MKREVDKNSYAYRELKNKYPDKTVFFYEYINGDYLNVDCTVYYDEYGKELHTVRHGNYG